MKNLLLNILLLVLGCGSDYSIYTHHYDLSKPIYINLEDKPTVDGKSSCPYATQCTHGLENAIIQAGGSVSESSPTAQTITLFNTDARDCTGNSVFAYTEHPSMGRIAVCHSIAVLNGCYRDMPTFFNDIMFHELGHELGNKSPHIGGDNIPIDKCESNYIMAWNIRCHKGVTRYIGEDLSYVCDNKTTRNGVCKNY